MNLAPDNVVGNLSLARATNMYDIRMHSQTWMSDNISRTLRRPQILGEYQRYI